MPDKDKDTKVECPAGTCPSPTVCKALSDEKGEEVCAAEIIGRSNQPAAKAKPGDRTAPIPKKGY